MGGSDEGVRKGSNAGVVAELKFRTHEKIVEVRSDGSRLRDHAALAGLKIHWTLIVVEVGGEISLDTKTAVQIAGRRKLHSRLGPEIVRQDGARARLGELEDVVLRLPGIEITGIELKSRKRAGGSLLLGRSTRRNEDHQKHRQN
jgi:hypothetical protein